MAGKASDEAEAVGEQGVEEAGEEEEEEGEGRGENPDEADIPGAPAASLDETSRSNSVSLPRNDDSISYMDEMWLVTAAFSLNPGPAMPVGENNEQQQRGGGDILARCVLFSFLKKTQNNDEKRE